MSSTPASPHDAKAFYERQFQGEQYTPWTEAESHSARADLERFVERYALADKHVLEVGCGRGVFQDLVDDYTGVDYAASAGKHLHKPFVEASATNLPFEDNTFDAVWTVWVLEHVPEPEQAFEEIARVLKPGGLLYLAPAWHCRSWAAEGYPVRPYSDFGLKGKLIKASIPIRNSVLWRSMFVFPARLRRLIGSAVRSSPTTLRYGTLEANFETFWMSDSDAINVLDPYESIVWFTSRGHECPSHPTMPAQFLVRNGAVVLRINKPQNAN